MANTYSNKLGNNGGRFYDFLNRPVLIDCNFIVDSANGNGLGIRSLKGSGVQNVFMYTSASAGKGNNGYLNPVPATGFALIQLQNNYNRYAGGFSGFVSPLSGSNVAINSTSLTVGNPYVITSVGHASAGAFTVATVADSSGSLAGTYFLCYDGYGQTICVWNYITGVGGSQPNLGSGVQYYQVTSAENAANTAVATNISNVMALIASPISGVYSFTTSVTGHTITVTSTQTNPYGPLPGPGQDGASPLNTGFTFTSTVYNGNTTCWRGVGLPGGVIPNVGASFIATATGFSTGGGSTGQVQAPSVSTISSVEVVGDPNQSVGPGPTGNNGGSPNVGAWIMVQFLAPVITGASSPYTTTMTPTAPTNGSVVGMSFVMEAGSILIAGE